MVAFVVALFVGVGAGGQWNDWIPFRNRVDFGVAEPQFGRDVGFYVFQLPFLSFLVDWLFAWWRSRTRGERTGREAGSAAGTSPAEW